ncbi:hypothetical protein Cgig2_013322 [Carnegiea gigantea]|uniref:Uncharacterized protein n=1 Tax=Carnegiea gigantea TaxID=171969 RepID=A0A9Q1JJ92_9CARY|nr:hypothetical protein Cgig2_013322 [Carnegiea gigantea]
MGEPVNATMIEQVVKPLVTITQVPICISYASVIDPDEGMEPQFVPTRIINGVKCGKLEKQDVVAEIKYWQNAVLCSILGANPSFEDVQGFMKCISTAFDIDKIIQASQAEPVEYTPGPKRALAKQSMQTTTCIPSQHVNFFQALEIIDTSKTLYENMNEGVKSNG